MIAYYALSTFYVVTCLILLLVILLQQGKGDMAAAFGGGSSQSAFGARAGATVLSKATAILSVLFMLGAMALSIMGRGGSSSVVSGTEAPPRYSEPSAPASMARSAAVLGTRMAFPSGAPPTFTDVYPPA